MIEYPRFKIPYFVKIHGSYSFLSGFPGSISFDAKIYANERNNLLKADTLIAVSEFAKRKLFEVYNYPFEIHVINNGVPIYDHVESNKTPESNKVIFAGTFSEQKGILNLIKAWKYVIKEIADATLLIYGRGEHRFKQKMSNAISDDAKGTIIINGFVEQKELLDAYAKAGCAIFPSFFETCGMAVLEAMQVGCPTIFTKNASGHELINDGYNGLLVNPDDILGIADKIIFLLKNRDYARRIGQNGANTVKLKFDINKVCKSHLELYKEVLNNKSA